MLVGCPDFYDVSKSEGVCVVKRIEDDKIKRAALYIRVSTEEQAMHGLSLTAQQETLLQYVNNNGLKLVDVYADQGITARKKYRNRTQFMRMLSDVEAGKIDIILFIKLDRWFRNVADYYEVQRVLDAHDVRWIATEESYDTTTANGRLHLNIKLSIAQDESDRTSERIKFVFDSKVKRGEVISGAAPLGFIIADKRLHPDPDTAPIVKDLFDRYIALRSIKALRRMAAARYGINYTDRGWRVLLQNERYIGRAHGQDGFCEAIIDAGTFRRAQEIIAERSQRNSEGRMYLFTGLIYCDECGSRMSAQAMKGKYLYYHCSGHEKRLCAHKKRVNELALEDWLLHNVVSQLTAYNSALKNKIAKPRMAVDVVKIKRKMDKLKDLYLNDLIDREAYESDYTSLKDELVANTSTPMPEPVDIAVVKSALSVYSELPRSLRRELWRNTIKKVTVNGNGDFFITPS